MDRKDFLSQVGIGAVALLIPACVGGLSSCTKTSNNTTAPTNVDFALDISTGSLSANGGFLTHNGVLVARTNTGTFLAVSAACTHEGTNVNYVASANDFLCPNHGAMYDSNGTVTRGPATQNLSKYNTSLTGTSLRVYS